MANKKLGALCLTVISLNSYAACDNKGVCDNKSLSTVTANKAFNTPIKNNYNFTKLSSSVSLRTSKNIVQTDTSNYFKSEVKMPRVEFFSKKNSTFYLKENMISHRLNNQSIINFSIYHRGPKIAFEKIF